VGWEIAREGFEIAVTSTFRSLAATLALSAMLLRAFLPAGWMPNPAGAADVPLIICSIDGAHHVLPAHSPQKGQQDEHGFACPFAAAAHLAPPQIAPAIAAPVFAGRLQAAFVVSDPIPDRGDAANAPRGPPTSI
jgi:hypothetical protein